MGIHDRDYMQAGPGGGSLLLSGRLIWVIIAINGVLWLVFSSALVGRGRIRSESSLYSFISEQLLLHPDAVFAEGKVWQLFTCMWLHIPSGPQHVLFNMLALWFFGRAVESFLGPRRFLGLYVGAGLGASLIYTLWSFAVGNSATAYGASGAVYAVLAWAALQQPRATIHLMMIFPVPMWLAVGVIVIGMEVLQFGSNISGAGASVAHLAGAACGALYWWLLPRFGRGAGYRDVAPRPPRAQATPPAAPNDLEEAHRRTAMRTAMDRLLDKVHAEGINSLTDEEKAILEEASQELRRR